MCVCVRSRSCLAGRWLTWWGPCPQSRRVQARDPWASLPEGLDSLLLNTRSAIRKSARGSLTCRTSETLIYYLICCLKLCARTARGVIVLAALWPQGVGVDRGAVHRHRQQLSRGQWLWGDGQEHWEHAAEQEDQLPAFPREGGAGEEGAAEDANGRRERPWQQGTQGAAQRLVYVPSWLLASHWRHVWPSVKLKTFMSLIVNFYLPSLYSQLNVHQLTQGRRRILRHEPKLLGHGTATQDLSHLQRRRRQGICPLWDRTQGLRHWRLHQDQNHQGWWIHVSFSDQTLRVFNFYQSLIIMSGQFKARAKRPQLYWTISN